MSLPCLKGYRLFAKHLRLLFPGYASFSSRFHYHALKPVVYSQNISALCSWDIAAPVISSPATIMPSTRVLRVLPIWDISLNSVILKVRIISLSQNVFSLCNKYNKSLLLNPELQARKCIFLSVLFFWRWHNKHHLKNNNMWTFLTVSASSWKMRLVNCGGRSYLKFSCVGFFLSGKAVLPMYSDFTQFHFLIWKRFTKFCVAFRNQKENQEPSKPETFHKAWIK